MTRPGETALHGWLVIDKPAGMTSARVVAAVKHATGAKVGHAGTLDPLATGVLPLALGEATKTVQFATAGRKRYRFRVCWGAATDTDDREGAVAAETPAGKPPTLADRPVEIAELRLLGATDLDHAEFEAEVGEGTYIRALARDLAEVLGTLGHIVELRRLSVGRFTETQAISLDSAVGLGHKLAASEHLLPIETALDDIPALALTAAEAARLRHGQWIPVHDRFDEGTLVAAEHDRLIVALARIEDGGLRPVRVINR
jgi:tRNA pseudouridine55 synthase